MHYQYTIMIGKSELIAQSTKDFKEGLEVSISVDPSNIQIMKKPFTSNFYDGYLTKDYKVEFAGGEFDCDILSIYKDCKFNEDGILVNSKGDEVEVEDKEVQVEVGFDGIEITDDHENCSVVGKIISMIYKGDHYQVIVRTEEEDDFILDTPDLWNENDEVGIIIKKENIHLKLKSGDKKHESSF